MAEGSEKNYEAINAKSDQTGITAEFDPKTSKITLVEESSSTIVVRDIHIEQEIANKMLIIIWNSPIDEYGKKVDPNLTDEDQLLGSGIENLLASIIIYLSSRRLLGRRQKQIFRQM